MSCHSDKFPFSGDKNDKLRISSPLILSTGAHLKAQEKPLSQYQQDEGTSCKLYVTEQRANSYKQNTIDEGQELQVPRCTHHWGSHMVKTNWPPASLLLAIILHMLWRESWLATPLSGNGSGTALNRKALQRVFFSHLKFSYEYTRWPLPFLSLGHQSRTFSLAVCEHSQQGAVQSVLELM